MLCYIVKAPVEFDEDVIDKAKKYVQQVMDASSAINMALLEAKGDLSNHDVQQKVVELIKIMPLDTDQEQAVALASAEYAYDGLVNDLLAACNGKYRDTATRADPHDPKYRIVVAGELSWGDEPEGAGYETLKAAACIGLFEVMGII